MTSYRDSNNVIWWEHSFGLWLNHRDPKKATKRSISYNAGWKEEDI